MIECKEREHELNDQEALNDHATIVAFCNYGILKFFMCPGFLCTTIVVAKNGGHVGCRFIALSGRKPNTGNIC